VAIKRFKIEDVPGTWETQDAGYSWNGWAVPLLTWTQHDEVSRAIGEDSPAPYEGLKAADGLCWVEVCMLKKGDLAKFHTPADDSEAKERFLLLEDPDGGRVLVRCLVDLPIPPTKVLRVEDLEGVQK